MENNKRKNENLLVENDVRKNPGIAWAENSAAAAPACFIAIALGISQTINTLKWLVIGKKVTEWQSQKDV